MKEPIIITIHTLATMLADATADKERAQQQLRTAEESGERIAEEADDLHLRLNTSENRVLFLQEEVADLRQRLQVVDRYVPTEEVHLPVDITLKYQRDTLQNQNMLLMSLFQRPETWEQILTYMNAHTLVGVPHEKLLSNKIAMIKRVREITGWGLKEAKEFVESYPTQSRESDSQAGHVIRYETGKDAFPTDRPPSPLGPEEMAVANLSEDGSLLPPAREYPKHKPHCEIERDKFHRIPGLDGARLSLPRCTCGATHPRCEHETPCSPDRSSCKLDFDPGILPGEPPPYNSGV